MILFQALQLITEELRQKGQVTINIPTETHLIALIIEEDGSAYLDIQDLNDPIPYLPSEG